MRVEVPDGDVVDRATILRIKRERIGSAAARANVERELLALESAWEAAGHPSMPSLPAFAELADVNGRLWDVEDALREHEARGDFGASFVDLARSVYRLNDRRAALKRAINDALGSRLVEEKSYAGAPRGIQGGRE